MTLQEIQAAVSRAAAEHRHAARVVADETARLRTETAEVETCLEAQKVVQTVAVAVQQAAHDQIAKVVSRCLEAVFDRPYKFTITFEQKRGRTEASLELERDGQKFDPENGVGGGVVDVAAFGLRVAVLMISTPRLRPLLVLDEPFRMVSAHYAERVREVVLTLARELGVQIIMVTHNTELACGNVIRL